METKLSVADSFRFGWNTFKQRPGMLIGGPLLLIVVTYAILGLIFIVAGIAGFGALFAGGVSGANMMPLILGGGAIMLVAFLIAIVIGTLAMMGMVSFFIKAHDDIAGVSLKDLIRTKPFLTFLGASIIVNIITQIGMAIFVIPGIIAALFLMFVSYLILDKDLGVIASIKESVILVKNNFLEVLLLVIALIAANILGALLLLVGLLVSVPVSALAVVHAYRTISSRPVVVASAPVAAPVV